MSAAEPTTEATEGFEAIIQVDALKTLFESVHTLVDECKLHLTPDGLEIAAVDPANVAMVDAELDEQAFESYRAEGGVIGVNVDRMIDVLSIPDSDQLANIYYDPDVRKLVVEVGGLEYTLALIDPESIRQEPTLPDLEFASRVVIEGEQLGRAIKAAKIATGSGDSGFIRVRSSEDDAVFHFEAEGDTDDVDYEFDVDDALDMTPGDARSLFSLDYWTDVTKPIGNDTRVAIRVGDEKPCRMAYSAVDGRLHLDYMVSPRIEEGS